MFSFSEKRWAGLAALAFAISLTFLQSFTAPVAGAASGCTCSEPSNGSILGQTTNSVTVRWEAVLGASGYEVKYYRTNDGYSSTNTFVGGNYFTFSDLSAGSYVFYVRTVCGDGHSDFVVLEDLILV